jgi:hypothetical protein
VGVHDASVLLVARLKRFKRQNLEISVNLELEERIRKLHQSV